MFDFAFESSLNFWFLFGAFLMIAEFILPGLVSIFVGLGALTVAGFIYFQIIESISGQLIVWFISSTVYIFTLRLLVMRYYPSDTETQNIDEEAQMMNKIVEVIEPISVSKNGRIRYGESTWVAIYKGEGEIQAGEKVKVVGRENISWIVEKTE
ncbi:MAG: NfeD family protein [Bdellovibrionales bacterium]|nr:NfeD family protein [Bdellovibrionales bacterium]